MTNATILASAVSLCCLCCTAQTNNCATPSIRFFLPPAQLRTEPPAQPEQNKTPVSIAPVTSLSVARDPLQDLFNDGDLHSRVIKSGEFYLTRANARPDTGFGRFLDQVFTPGVVHVGKASLACPFITAIKRQNPLSVLSGFSVGTATSGNGAIVFKLIDLSW